MAKPPNPNRDKILELSKSGVSAPQIAKTLGVEAKKVYATIHYWRRKNAAIRQAKLTTRPVTAGEITPHACIAITVDPEHIVALKLRNPDLQGTLYVSKNGVAYSKPNAKLKPTEFLSFEQLSKLVDSGLFAG